jgi:hypothetical protein
MYAVLIEVDVSGVDPDQGLSALREQIVPSIKAMPGFRSGTWLPANEDGQGLSFTLWDTKAHAEVMADRFGPGSSPTADASVIRCEIREVAATA